jgi:class 3 adenylate cyclase
MDKDTSTGRRLSAILAADIAGYSRLMGQDEAARSATSRATRP